MQQDYHDYRQGSRRSLTILSVPGWMVALASLAFAAGGVIIFLVSASLLLIFAPVFIAFALYMRWRFMKALRAAASMQDTAAPIIETEYHVHDEKRRR